VSTAAPARLRPLDRDLAVLVVAGAGCLLLEAAAAHGQVALWPAGVPPNLPIGAIVSHLAIPVLVLTILGHRPLAWVDPRPCMRRVRPLIVAVVVAAAVGVAIAAVEPVRAYYRGPASPLTASLARSFVAVLCVEFFFRGFLVLPLVASLGWSAILIGILPYALLHAGKPLLEAYGSIAFGLGLSWLAVRTRSILYGVAVHWVLAAVTTLAAR
jgi:membrane protease YdiL (CAAX protease family)